MPDSLDGFRSLLPEADPGSRITTAFMHEELRELLIHYNTVIASNQERI